MNTIKKFFTVVNFDREGFAAMLRETMDIRAVAVHDGVILDVTAYNEYKPAEMPVWAYNNKRHINSLVRTRIATDAEAELLKTAHQFALVGASGIEYKTSNNLNKLIAAGLELQAHYTNILPRKYYIVNKTTGKQIAAI